MSRLEGFDGVRKLGRVGHYIAVLEGDDSVGVFGNFGVVGYKDDRQSEILVELTEHSNDVLARLGIQVPGGLVPHQNRGIADQSASDGYALLLTARELAWVVVESVSEPYLLQNFLDSHFSLTRREPFLCIKQRNLDIFHCRSSR